MKNTKREAYEAAARLLFEAAERLREALDTADLEGLTMNEAAFAYLNEAEQAITKQAQNYQRGANGGRVADNAIHARLKPNGKTLILENGTAATFEPFERYTADNGRDMVRYAALLNLWQGDIDTLRRLADQLPDIDGRRPTIAEAYHAAATYGLHHWAELMGIKADTTKREA